MEYGLDLDGAEIQLDPEDRDVPPGYFWIYATSGEDTITLKGKLADGSTFTGPTFTQD